MLALLYVASEAIVAVTLQVPVLAFAMMLFPDTEQLPLFKLYEIAPEPEYPVADKVKATPFLMVALESEID